MSKSKPFKWVRNEHGSQICADPTPEELAAPRPGPALERKIERLKRELAKSEEALELVRKGCKHTVIKNRGGHIYADCVCLQWGRGWLV
jgi:hypothetical protein